MKLSRILGLILSILLYWLIEFQLNRNAHSKNLYRDFCHISFFFLLDKSFGFEILILIWNILLDKCNNQTELDSLHHFVFIWCLFLFNWLNSGNFCLPLLVVISVYCSSVSSLLLGHIVAFCLCHIFFSGLFGWVKTFS